ncbi:MAG: hypothetical protein ACYDCH_04465 [Gaiellaceae bacterium]
MISFQIASVSLPHQADGSPLSAIDLLIRAQTMGYLPPEAEGRITLDVELLERVLGNVEAAGVATRPISLARLRGKKLQDTLREVVEAIDASPNPAGEWGPAREVLGDELLGRLLEVSESSLRRYANGERETPGEVGWKLHAIAKVIAFTLGSYNYRGIQLWFDNRRLQLDEKTPAEVFRAATSEADLEPVVRLAHTLIG